MGRKIKSIALPIIGAAIGSAVPGIGTALGASIGSGAGTLASGGNIGQALLSGVGGYAGGNIAGSVLGNSLGTVGSALGLSTANALPWAAANSSLGSALASGIGSSAANSIAGSSIASVLGSQYGSSLAANAFGNDDPMPQMSAPAEPAGPAPFDPKQEDEQEVPASLNSLGSLTSQQRTSNLANQGVFGGGNGPAEQKYFLNQINRRLVDNTGKLSDLSSLSPIEQSYIQKLGLGNNSNTKSLLEAISKWKAA